MLSPELSILLFTFLTLTPSMALIYFTLKPISLINDIDESCSLP